MNEIMINYYNTLAHTVGNIYEYGRKDDLLNAVLANKMYYEKGTACPSLARLVYRDTFKKYDEKYKEQVKQGQESLSDFAKRTQSCTKNAVAATKYEPAKSAFKGFKASVDTLYGHSWWIRTFTVDNDRIVMDKIKDKASAWHKFKVGILKNLRGAKHFFK